MTVLCCPVRQQSHPSCDPEDVTSRQQVKARHGQHQNDPTKTEAWTPSLTEVSLTPPSTKSKHVAVVVVKSYLLLRRRHPEMMHASTKPRLARPPEIEHQSSPPSCQHHTQRLGQHFSLPPFGKSFPHTTRRSSTAGQKSHTCITKQSPTFSPPTALVLWPPSKRNWKC